MTTVNIAALTPAGARRLSAEAAALREKFPPRLIPAGWEATGQDRGKVLGRLVAPPFALDNPGSQNACRLGLIKTLDWLEAQPGKTWQDRWTMPSAARRRSARSTRLPA
jgi:hypothetical protein